MRHLPALLLGLIAGTPTLHAQGVFDNNSVEPTARAYGLGVGSVASSNEAGRGTLVSPSNALSSRPSLTGEYTYAPATLEVDIPGDGGGSLDIASSTYKAIALIPVGRLNGATSPSGFALNAGQTRHEFKGGESWMSKTTHDIDRIAAVGTLGIGPLTIGLEGVFFSETSRTTSSYTVNSGANGNGSPAKEVSYRDSHKADFTNFHVGVGLEVGSGSRIAAVYVPRLIRWHDEKSERTEVNLTTGATTQTSEDDVTNIGEDEEVAIGAQIRANRAWRILPGVSRVFPHTETHEEQRGTRTIRDSRETNDSTTWSLGADYVQLPGVTPFGSISYGRLSEGTMRGISAGANVALSPVTLGLTGSYRVAENLSDTSDLTLKAWTAAVSVGGQF